MMNPISYVITNISWYEPVYNQSWVMMMIGTFLIPFAFVFFFKLPGLRKIQPTKPAKTILKTSWLLLLAVFFVFAFRLIPYWVFTDKWLHFMGGGLSIALVYEYFVINFCFDEAGGIINLSKIKKSPGLYFVANIFLLVFFVSFYSVGSEISEFISKYYAHVQFNSSGIDTWLDIIANTAGCIVGYLIIFIIKEIKLHKRKV